MNKKTRTDWYGQISCCSFDTKVVDIITRLQEIVSQHGPNVFFDYDYGCGEFDIGVKREETEEEYQQRITSELKQEEKERKEYERLKKKFEGK